MIAKITIQVALVIGLISALMHLTGCSAFNPEGFEFGAKVGMYAVDQREESSRTMGNGKPFVCSLVGSLSMCKEQEVVHGS